MAQKPLRPSSQSSLPQRTQTREPYPLPEETTELKEQAAPSRWAMLFDLLLWHPLWQIRHVSRWDWFSACLAMLAFWFLVDIWGSTFSHLIRISRKEDLLPSQEAAEILALGAHHDHDWTNFLICILAILGCRFLIRSDRRRSNRDNAA